MEPPKPLDPDPKIRPFPLPNGALKKLPHPRPSPAPAAADALYRECLKNHAATLGGHAVDGCGEFMSSPASNPSDPTSLTCAACGCHRNFHRRSPLPRPPSDELDGGDSPDDDEAHRSSSSPPPYFSSAPHMLLALSAGLSPAAEAGTAAAPPLVPARKRFRTRFSPEQKGRMQELSEKLGWRMQKRDEGLVEEWCREIGVGKGVFKVWMHNNKHSYLGGGKRGGEGNNVGGEMQGNGGVGGGEGGSSHVTHVVNGSSSSS